jgi:hypothetical protein
MFHLYSVPGTFTKSLQFLISHQHTRCRLPALYEKKDAQRDKYQEYAGNKDIQKDDRLKPVILYLSVNHNVTGHGKDADQPSHKHKSYAKQGGGLKVRVPFCLPVLHPGHDKKGKLFHYKTKPHYGNGSPYPGKECTLIGKMHTPVPYPLATLFLGKFPVS